MGISLAKSGLSAGVGVADELLEMMDRDATTPRVEPFQNATDVGRLVMAGAGYAAQLWGRGRTAEYGEVLAYSATPLLVKSVHKAIKSEIGTTSASRRFAPRRMAAMSPAAIPTPTMSNRAPVRIGL